MNKVMGKGIWVDWENGSDENGDGTPGNPFATHRRVDSAVQAGRPVTITVTLENGTETCQNSGLEEV